MVLEDYSFLDNGYQHRYYNDIIIDIIYFYIYIFFVCKILKLPCIIPMCLLKNLIYLQIFFFYLYFYLSVL